MSTEQELENIAALAYLELQAENSPQLAQDVIAIMNFVEQLRELDTSTVEPLFHPLDVHQRLREDTVTETNCVAALAKIAPVFVDNLYLVPKVIDSGK